MNKFNLVSAVLQLASGLVLAGLSVYYFIVANYVSGAIFLAVGVFFTVSPVRGFIKARKEKKNKDGADGKEEKRPDDRNNSLDFKI